MKGKYFFLKKYLEVYELARDEPNEQKIMQMFCEAGFDSTETIAAVTFIQNMREAGNEQ